MGNTDKNTDKRLKNLKPAWKKGKSGNPKGKPFGQRDYATIYREALIMLAKEKGKTPEEFENELLKVGLIRATSKDYRFYKDILDRIHGQAKQVIDNPAQVEAIKSLEEIIKTMRK